MAIPNSAFSIVPFFLSTKPTALPCEDLPVDYGDWLPKPEPKNRRRAGVLLPSDVVSWPHMVSEISVTRRSTCSTWLHFSGCFVLPLVPPGNKANEEGSPYSGQV
ncbi:hypothetical protein Patl1_27564 [Pistacia atlantica]|uniref:Uncharacterized protein n=1 Tax=Pistacia atlantica TaxID=434234 RepID=A0ACC1BCA5_9ROSI|nr:hypothetical protein Patl1_27564 [Pistacia atlantica]